MSLPVRPAGMAHIAVSSNSIVPNEKAGPALPTTSRFVRLQDALTGTLRAVEHWQVSHHGRYTEARLRSLAVYSKRKSGLRVFLVLVLTPMPIFCFVIGIESIPLAAPRAGSMANYVWWTRHSLCLVMMTISSIVQVKSLLPKTQLSFGESLVIVVVTNAGYVGFLLILAVVWTFPIPFVFALTGGMFTILLVITFNAVLRYKRRPSATGSNVSSSSNHTDEERFAAFKRIVILETLLASIYPGIERSFSMIQGRWQLLFPVILVVIKLVLKQLIGLSVRRGRLETQLPELIVFTIELFHTLYLTACFNAKTATIEWMIVVTIFDFLLSLSSVYMLVRHAKSVEQLFQLSESTFRSRRSSLLESAVDALTAQKRKTNRRILLKSADAFKTIKRMLTARIGPTIPQMIAAAPEGQKSMLVRSLSRRRSAVRSRRIQIEQADQTMRVFSKAEYFIFVEYVECVIPLVYGAFHVCLRRLPNASFYSASPSMAVFAPSLLSNVTLFVGIKMLSLAGFSLFLYYRLRFVILHQLAFALEEEMINIQAKFVIFIPYCLFFFLAHNGVDFSFSFRWIHGDWSE